MYKIKVQYGQGFDKNKNWFVPAEGPTLCWALLC